MWKNKSARVIPLLFTPPLLSSLPVIGIPADPLLIFHCIRSGQRFYLSTRSNDVTPWRCFRGIVRRNTRLRRQRDAKADSRNGRSIRRKRESELRLNARRKKERERESIAFSALPFLTSRRASSRRQLDSPGWY